MKGFVRAETLVQEITADGRVRDHVTRIPKKPGDEKEEYMRSLPEFKQMRGEGGPSLSEQQQAEKTAEEKEEAYNRGENIVHTIDAEEYEHYQALHEAAKAHKRASSNADYAAVSTFRLERENAKKMKLDTEADKSRDLFQKFQDQKMAVNQGPATAAATKAVRPAPVRGKLLIKQKAAPESAAGESQLLSLSRAELIERLFSASGGARAGLLGSSGVFTVAKETGFDGSESDWKQEFEGFCDEAGADAEAGITSALFQQLLDDESEGGLYCDDTRLRQILVKMDGTARKSLEPAAQASTAVATGGLLSGYGSDSDSS